MEALQPQRQSQGVEFLDEEGQTVLRRVAQGTGAATAGLVVEDDASLGPGQQFQWLQIVVGQPGPPGTSTSGDVSSKSPSPTVRCQRSYPGRDTTTSRTGKVCARRAGRSRRSICKPSDAAPSRATKRRRGRKGMQLMTASQALTATSTHRASNHNRGKWPRIMTAPAVIDRRAEATGPLA